MTDKIIPSGKAIVDKLEILNMAIKLKSHDKVILILLKEKGAPIIDSFLPCVDMENYDWESWADMPSNKFHYKWTRR